MMTRTQVLSKLPNLATVAKGMSLTDKGSILSDLQALLQWAITNEPGIIAFVESLIVIFGGTVPAPAKP